MKRKASNTILQSGRGNVRKVVNRAGVLASNHPCSHEEAVLASSSSI